MDVTGARAAGVDVAPVVRLSAVVPELLDAVPSPQRPQAERVLTSRAIVVRDEPLDERLATAGASAFGFLVADGLVVKETLFGGESALEILGPGDVLAVPLDATFQLESRARSHYLAHGTASLAILEDRFLAATAHWPRMAAALFARMGRQTHRTSMHLAMLHMPRAEDRVMALFADLAERFGRMTPDGIVLDVDLTHELIGRLIGSRRPTVSLALAALGAEGRLDRTNRHRWRLAAGAVLPG